MPTGGGAPGAEGAGGPNQRSSSERSAVRLTKAAVSAGTWSGRGRGAGGWGLGHVDVDIAVDRRSLEDRAVVHPGVPAPP